MADRRRCRGKARGPTLITAALALLVACPPAASVPLSPTESDDIERTYTAGLRQIYGAWLARTGSTLAPSSPEWEDSLHRTVTAVFAGRPVDCALALWVLGGCGQHTYDVPSRSMLPSILNDDVVMTLPASPARPIRRGDVVAYRAAPDPSAYMHRVIGLPGDRISLVGGTVVLDGRPLDRAPTGRVLPPEDGDENLAEYRERLPGGRAYAVLWPNRDLAGVHGADMAEMTVPPNRYVVMGDNRSRSLDSRTPDGHGLPEAAGVVGVVKSIIISREPSRIGTVP